MTLKHGQKGGKAAKTPGDTVALLTAAHRANAQAQALLTASKLTELAAPPAGPAWGGSGVPSKNAEKKFVDRVCIERVKIVNKI